MSIASIVFADEGGDNVNIRLVFGDKGIDESSPAHQMAVQALSVLMKANEQVGEMRLDDEDDYGEDE